MSAKVPAKVAEEDLEALFDSIITDNAARERADSQNEASVEQAASTAEPETMMSRIGHLTRMLHDALHQLGYDRMLEQTAKEIPDVRDRLAYVLKMTEQAAVRALNAIETAQPIQDNLAEQAKNLSSQWQKLFDKQLSVADFKELVANTRSYLDDVPQKASATNVQLMEIMMAQDFQDLTGQVMKKITNLAQDLEHQLVHILVDLVPKDKRDEIDTSLLNGPVVNAEGKSDVVTNQDQVDDLLESLGF